jgi:hypothetical protein
LTTGGHERVLQTSGSESGSIRCDAMLPVSQAL